MRILTETAVPEELVGHYGVPGRRHAGILVDHLYLFTGLLRQNAEGVRVAVGSDGTEWPVLCSEIIGWTGSEGPCDGRCGVPIKGDAFTCARHTGDGADFDDDDDDDDGYRLNVNDVD